MPRFLEACSTSPAAAQEAERGGASRIELCRDLPCGGLTPEEADIREAVRRCRIPVNILIRPRPGDFVYSEAEIAAMVRSIHLCREIGAHGVVIGALNKQGQVDSAAMRTLIAAARPLSITFHRAFDVCAGPQAALEDIIALGCDRLLTSGHEADAYAGRFRLAELVRQAAGRIVIMAGCGIRDWNIAEIEAVSGAPEYHSSSMTLFRSSPSEVL